MEESLSPEVTDGAGPTRERIALSTPRSEKGRQPLKDVVSAVDEALAAIEGELKNKSTRLQLDDDRSHSLPLIDLPKQTRGLEL